MASIVNEIQNALETRLSTLAGLPSVAWPNQDFTPVSGTSWLRPTLLPAETVAATMDGDLQTGIFQVDVFVPSGTGRSAGDTLVDAIGDHFAPMLELTSGATTVRIISFSTIAARSESDWYHIPLEIRYNSITANR